MNRTLAGLIFAALCTASFADAYRVFKIEGSPYYSSPYVMEVGDILSDNMFVMTGKKDRIYLEELNSNNKFTIESNLAGKVKSIITPIKDSDKVNTSEHKVETD